MSVPPRPPDGVLDLPGDEVVDQRVQDQREASSLHPRGLTGADELESKQQVINRLYRVDAPAIRYEWPRLPHAYHGSGCTLAAACAARLALDEDLEQAVSHAQRYTRRSLSRATRPGHGQYLPMRWTPCD